MAAAAAVQPGSGSCPRCLRGRLFADLEGERVCYQCGFTVYPTAPLPWVKERRPEERGGVASKPSRRR